MRSGRGREGEGGEGGRMIMCAADRGISWEFVHPSLDMESVVSSHG